MSGRGGTGGHEAFEKIMKEFEASFTTELIPGILHNFANPLNGIMGRSRLLQRRATKNLENISEYTQVDEETLKECKKVIDDIDLILNETDRLFNLFNDVAGKFYRLSDTTVQKINLSELIKTEMAFFDFYLDFKHQVKKKMVLDEEIPEVTGSPADYSIALSTLIKHAINSMKDSEMKTLTVSTNSDATHVCVRIENTSVQTFNDDEKELLQNWDNFSKSYDETNVDRNLFNALSLLKKYDAFFQFEDRTGFNVISAHIPY